MAGIAVRRTASLRSASMSRPSTPGLRGNEERRGRLRRKIYAACASLAASAGMTVRLLFRLAPDLAGQVNDHPQLRPLFLLGEHVALLGRSEAALRRQAELLERCEFRRLLDAALHVVLLFERAALRRDKAEHDDLVAL